MNKPTSIYLEDDEEEGLDTLEYDLSRLKLKPLKYLETLLAPHHFFRTHHSHLINLDQVKKYVKSDGGYIEMVDRSIVNISRSKKEAFIGLFKNK